jgi:hypothetical protein
MEIRELENWLFHANRRYADQKISHIQRPWLAMRELASITGAQLFSGSPFEKHLFSWFEKNSPDGAHDISTVFIGAYYFDAAFWPVQIGLLIGCAQVDPLKSLRTMPNLIKHQMAYSKSSYTSYIKYWANCWDYCYGLDAIEKTGSLSNRSSRFLQSGNKELQCAISQLTTPSPNLKAIISLRLSIEIFLKTILIQELSLSDKELMAIGHSIKNASDKCFDITKDTIFSEISVKSSSYPSISDRYEFSEPEIIDVWGMVQDAQSVSAALTRRYSHQETLSSLVAEINDIPTGYWKYD